jgi:guanine deaminase
VYHDADYAPIALRLNRNATGDPSHTMSREHQTPPAEPIVGEPRFMEQAIALATENVRTGRGGPFGCVIVHGGEVLATGVNLVTSSNDPTAHAEVTAIRNACQALGTFQLTGCDVYTSCEPCPMCLAALYWSRCRAIFFGNTAADAARIGFDDSFLYEEVKRPLHERLVPIRRLLGPEAFESFAVWAESPYKVDY